MAIFRHIRFDGTSIQLLPALAYDVRYVPDVPIIGFAFDGQTGTHAFASDKVTDFRASPNSLAYVPGGCEVISRSDAGGEYLSISVAATDWPKAPAVMRFNNLINRAAIRIAEDLRRRLLTGDQDLLQLEHAAAQLRAIVAMAGGLKPSRAERWLTPYRMRLIDELIDDRMEDALTVGELARTLDLSIGFFARAFRHTMGKPPHQYILDRRIARARSLLHEGTSSLTEVALACGFSSHAHMTAQMRARLGITP